MASLPIVDVKVYIKETSNIRRDPGSLKIAVRGPSRPYFAQERLREYVPAIIRNIPQNPPVLIFSPNIIQPVKIMNPGVKARKGTVRDRGETLMAFI